MTSSAPRYRASIGGPYGVIVNAVWLPLWVFEQLARFASSLAYVPGFALVALYPVLVRAGSAVVAVANSVIAASVVDLVRRRVSTGNLLPVGRVPAMKRVSYKNDKCALSEQ